MDDDEAFLYGDDAPSTTVKIEEPKQTVPEDLRGAQSQIHDPPLEGLSSAVSQSQMPSFTATFIPSQTPIGSSAAGALEDPPNVKQPQLLASEKEPTPEVNDRLQNPDAVANVEVDGEAGAAREVDADGEQDDDMEGTQDSPDESEDDLDIILEGDNSYLVNPPPSKPLLLPPKPETPRDLIPLQSTLEQLNVTTEYKLLDRTGFKVPEPPTRNEPNWHLNFMNGFLSHNSNNQNQNGHNRLPTPENFPIPSTPPAQPPLNIKPPDVNADNPTVPCSYNDKDGTALLDFDFDAIAESEKGWKKPGAHLADWFNYGFDETTWRLYVMKQKKLRKEEGWSTNPFAAFATGNIQEAWDELSSELKGVMMQTIMGNNSGPVNNNHASQMPPSISPMMMMNPMMQGMDMGAYRMPGIQNLIGGGNANVNGGHNNSGMMNNDDLSRVIKQDATISSDHGGHTPGQYGEDVHPREQHHERIQEQMRHMQQMQHMGMGAAFMPGMDLAAMFGNPEHSMFMNGPQYNGMMDMPQVPHVSHLPPQMQQQIVGTPMMNLGISQATNLNSSSNGKGAIAAGAVPLASGPPSPVVDTPVVTPAAGVGTHASTPGDSPRTAAVPSPVGARGRGRSGRGRGNAQASAFLAAAAARGRGRVLSAANTTPLPSNMTATPGPSSDAPSQINTAVVPNSVCTLIALPVTEASPDRLLVKPVSPLPSNVPTGPRKALTAIAGPPPRAPRGTPGGYFDKDAVGARGDEGLDYGGGGVESPRDERKSLSLSRKHSHRSERDKTEEDPRAVDRNEERSERSRSKSKDKELEEKDNVHRTSKLRHRHRPRSKSRDPEHRNTRDKIENKEDGSHKSSKSSGGSRRSRRNRRNTEGDDKEEDRESGGAADERERNKEQDKDRSREDIDHAEGEYSVPTPNGSRKRKPKEERSSRSKRERAE